MSKREELRDMKKEKIKEEDTDKKKNLPVGIDNFEVMIQKDYYYFDKTGLIKEILESGTLSILFTRPRRFGKSLNMSMLKYFFDVKNNAENRKLFDGLEISKSKYFDKQGMNPVIFISFKDFEVEEVKKWYNGYHFGKNEVYNPWSIVNFLDDKILEEHWVNTSNNDEIMNYLENSDENIIFDLEKLLAHESVRKEIYNFVTFQDIDYALNINNKRNMEIKENIINYEKERNYYINDFGQANIWQFFLHCGYLTIDKKVDKNIYDLKIPNEELFDFFKIRFLYRTYGGHYRFSTLEEYLRTGKYEKFRNEVKTLLKNSVSFRDLKEENSYHLFVMGMVAIMYENYYIKSNYESGDGIPDLVLKPKNKRDTAFIFEFKYSRAKNSKNLKRTAKSALKQINDRNYADGLKYEGYENITKIGMGFRKKDVEVAIEIEFIIEE